MSTTTEQNNLIKTCRHCGCFLFDLDGFCEKCKTHIDQEFHVEKIVCPECDWIQEAKVEHTIPWHTYVHTCEKCKHIIMESEWNNYKPSTTTSTEGKEVSAMQEHKKDLSTLFSVDLLFNNEWPINEEAKSYMGESYDDYVKEYNEKEAAVWFSNTYVEYDSCDCGGEYGCSHGGYPYKISFANNNKVCEGDFEDDTYMYLTGTRNTIRVEDYTKMTMGDFIAMCGIAGINLEFKKSPQQ